MSRNKRQIAPHFKHWAARAPRIQEL